MPPWFFFCIFHWPKRAPLKKKKRPSEEKKAPLWRKKSAPLKSVSAHKFTAAPQKRYQDTVCWVSTAEKFLTLNLALQESCASWNWEWESTPLIGRLVCVIQSNWIKSKPTGLVQHIGYLSSHPRKLMMIKYEFSSSPQCSWGSRSDVSSTKWGSTHTSPPRHTPCHVARGK